MMTAERAFEILIADARRYGGEFGEKVAQEWEWELEEWRRRKDEERELHEKSLERLA